MAQLHKKFTDAQVKELIIRYLNKEIERNYIEKILDIKRRRLDSIISLLFISYNMPKQG